MTKGRALVLVGTALYVVAWLVSVHKDGQSSMLPGWEAFALALWPYGSSDAWYTGVHIIASAMTNFFLVGALVLVYVVRRSPPRVLRGILIASSVLNTHWFVFGELREGLRIGYYFWAGSFFLVATGLVLEARRAGGSSESAIATGL